MSSLDNIKKRIASIETTKKITNAMKLVATSNLKKQKELYQNTRDYYKNFHEIFLDLIREKGTQEINSSKSNKTVWIIITSSLGLCGAFNSQIVKKLVENFNKETDEIILIGKKGRLLLKSRGLIDNVKIYINIDPKDIDYSICESLIDEFRKIHSEGSFKKINLIYTKFINSLSFEPKITQIIPIDEEKLARKAIDIYDNYMTYEPSAEEMIKKLLPQFLVVVLHGAILESTVSENSSRRNSMENASKNASDLKDDLLNQYNAKRQSKITQEINEIIGGNIDENK